MENLKDISKELERILTDYYQNRSGEEYIKEVIPNSTYFSLDDKVYFFYEGAYYQGIDIIDVCIDVYANYIDHHHYFDFTLNKMVEEVEDMINYGDIYFSDEICIQTWIQKHNAKYPNFEINENVKECYEMHHNFDVRDYTEYVDSSEIIFSDDEDNYECFEFEDYNNDFNNNYDYLKEILDNNDVDIDKIMCTYYYSNREIVAWNIKSNSIEIYHHAGNEMCRSCTTLIFENGVKGV